MLVAEAQVKTEAASRYLVQLCRHFNDKVDARPEVQADIEWSETDGIADFGWGRCTMQANPDALTVRAEADDQEGLQQIRELVTRVLEKFGAGEHLMVAWQHVGAPAPFPDEARHGGERMRQFHRRARRSAD